MRVGLELDNAVRDASSSTRRRSMALTPCLRCGTLTKQTRCRRCAKTTTRGYGWKHQQRAESGDRIATLVLELRRDNRPHRRPHRPAHRRRPSTRTAPRPLPTLQLTARSQAMTAQTQRSPEKSEGSTHDSSNPIECRCAFCEWTITAPIEEARQAFHQHQCPRPRPTATTRRRRGFQLDPAR